MYSVPTMENLAAPSSAPADPHTQKLWELSVKQLQVNSKSPFYLKKTDSHIGALLVVFSSRNEPIHNYLIYIS